MPHRLIDVSDGSLCDFIHLWCTEPVLLNSEALTHFEVNTTVRFGGCHQIESLDVRYLSLLGFEWCGHASLCRLLGDFGAGQPMYQIHEGPDGCKYVHFCTTRQEKLLSQGFEQQRVLLPTLRVSEADLLNLGER